MKFLILIFSLLALCDCCSRSPHHTLSTERDLYADTWVACDALGRTMPTSGQVGLVKNDKARTVGIFYVTWHHNAPHGEGNDYTADVTQILDQYPEAYQDGKHPAWQKGYHHWGEPEMGYFLSTDPWVVRRDMSMLADAGVDVLIMDATNAVRYWKEWEVTFSVMQQMQKEGNKVPKFCFWAFNGPVITVVQDIYEKIYKQNKYKDLWFYWDEKPLILWNSNPLEDATQNKINKNINHNFDSLAVTQVDHPHYGNPDYTQAVYTDYTQEVKQFFTTRMMWWGYYQWKGKRFVGTEGNWSFGYDLGHPQVRTLSPDQLVATWQGEAEQMAVTPAQHAHSAIGKSWSRAQGKPQLNALGMPQATDVPWLGKTVDNPSAYGIYFQERWDEAIAQDPAFIYINDWNEWTAIKFRPDQVNVKHTNGKTNFLGQQKDYLFVDQFNAEFNRTIQPMKDGYTDNYYMQMVQNIRRYKGVRALPSISKTNTIHIDGAFDDWLAQPVEYRDTKGDTKHRNHPGYGNFYYKNTTGRNDIITAKVAVGMQHISFYVETAKPLTKHTGKNWMVLLIDADNNTASGWNGYDFMVKDYSAKAKLYRFENGKWLEHEKLTYAYQANQLELSIPLFALHLPHHQFTLDFKWTDNPCDLDHITSLFNNGDTAPNRRFNYRCIYHN